MTSESRLKEKKKLVQILIREPKKQADKFVEGFMQANEAMKMLEEAGFGQTGMVLTEVVQEVLDSIGDEKIL